MKRKNTALNLAISMLLPFVVGAVILALWGYNPAEAYTELFKGAFVGKLSLGTTIERFGPIFLTGIAFIFSIRVNFFNLGVEGALYLGALTAAALGLLTDITPAAHKIFIIIGAMLVGALWGALPGFLKARYRVNEACSTIMLNYVAKLFCSYMIIYVWFSPDGSGKTKNIEASARLARLLPPSRVSTAVIIWGVLFVIAWWILNKTDLGFQMRSLGANAQFAQYIGVRTHALVVLSAAISGAIGGLAGSLETMGVYYSMYDGFSANIAFDGMLAALLAKNDIRKLPFTALLIAAMKAGALGMERNTGVPKALIDCIVPLLIILLSVGEWITRKAPKRKVS